MTGSATIVIAGDIGSTARLRPPMPALAPDDVNGWRVLAGLRRNAFSAFPKRCLDDPVIHMKMPWRSLVLATGAAAIRDILQTHAADFGRVPAGRRVLGPIVGRGLLTSEGEAWRRQRRAMAPAFTPRMVPVLARHIARCTDTACDRLETTRLEPIDLLAFMQRLSLDVAAATMFSLEAENFGDALRTMITAYMTTIGRPRPSDFLFPAGMPTPLSLRRHRFRRRWTALIGGIVATRRAQARAEAPRDLFDLMSEAHGDGAEDLLADEVATMIVAGHETTALALFWACLLLAQAPEWQTLVADEVHGLDLSPGGAAASLPKLHITKAVVQEALRLYPPAFMTAKMARRVRPIADVRVPAGAIVLIPFFLLHRDPRHWSLPDVFDPSRFLGPSDPQRFTYLPFGAGPNVCIGAQLAMTEAVLVLARLIAGSKLTLTENKPVMPVGILSTRPDHAPAFLFRRR